jgi:hypothetical protein
MASLEAANLELRLKLRVGDEAKAKEGNNNNEKNNSF